MQEPHRNAVPTTAQALGIMPSIGFDWIIPGSGGQRIPGNLNVRQLYGPYFQANYPKVKTLEQMLKVLSDNPILIY